MATNPAPFPVPNESPYGDKVQNYIDAGDYAVEAAAGQAADQKIVTHAADADPHTQYLPRASTAFNGNLNTLVTPGRYYVGSTATNRPNTALTSFHVEVITSHHGIVVTQRATQVSSTQVDRTWVRNSVNTGAVWTPWVIDGEKSMTEHVAAADPHTQYARKASANTFTVPQTFSTGTYQTMLQRANNAVDLKNWWFFVELDGSVRLIPKADDGVTTNGRGTVIGRDGSLQVGDQRFLSGTGFPEGVVSAPVGSRYVDTAATNGAVEWIKASGSGSSGWRVAYGDTGWRDISSLIYPGATLAETSGRLLIKRDGSDVWLSIITGAVGFENRLYVPMTGFRPRSGVSTTAMVRKRSNPNDTFMWRVDTTVDYFPATSEAVGTAHWATQDAWPDTLPGTPA